MSVLFDDDHCAICRKAFATTTQPHGPVFTKCIATLKAHSIARGHVALTKYLKLPEPSQLHVPGVRRNRAADFGGPPNLEEKNIYLIA